MNSKNTEKTFFEGKRPWSKIKDNILKDYLPIYLSKVSKLHRPIILIDAFAGPGVFEDGSEGSPIIMAKSAERYAKGKYLAIFVNSEEEHRTRLEKELKKVSDTALTILGTAQELLREVKKVLSNQTVFVYLDPFGLKDCEFSLLKPFLERSTSYSTEIIINMSMPTLHRLATSKAKMTGKETSQTKALNERLTKVLGGDYWKEIMWNTSLNSQEKETKVMEKYRELLSKYLSYKGSCPVKERREKRVKYFITLCSRHQDAMLLMNDIMCKAYFKQMHEIEFKGTLFEGKLDWRTTKETGNIEPIILNAANNIPGKSRKNLWLSIIQKHFMRWTSSEYKNSVQKLIEQGELICPTPHKRKQLNDECLLFPKNKDFIHRSQGGLIIEEPITIYSQIKKSNKKIKIHFDEYKMVNGDVATLVSHVADGSIVKRFDKTPYPVKPTDVICPHFLELKWAYGCPFDCSWCYLKGTFRFRPEGIKPAYKPLEKVKLHIETFLQEVETPEILNTGEIADSLMGENGDCPFSKFIITLFENQSRHKVLFVTKSTNVKNLLEIASPRQVIISSSLNAKPVAERWEKKAPPVERRIEAARKLSDAGYEVRIRIDPMVPVESWRESYIELIDEIFLEFIPERITLGSLRGLQSTINGTKDTSWVKYLKEGSNWGKKIDFTTRYRMYATMIEHLGNRYNYHNIALCKETKAMWEKLGIDWSRIRCNCVW